MVVEPAAFVRVARSITAMGLAGIDSVARAAAVENSPTHIIAVDAIAACFRECRLAGRYDA